MKALRFCIPLALAVLSWSILTPSAHAQDSLKPGEKINGYTGVLFDTTQYPYDYLVDSSLPQDDPTAKKFKTLQAAYTAAPAGTPQKPTVIGIKPDVYFLPAEPSAPASLTITKNNITFLGLTDDRRKVVLADNRGNKEGATNNGYILDVNADGFSMINLTVVNFCNLDYEYPGNPAKNLKMRSPVITQAVAVQTQGDRHLFSHVAILSRLDTMFIRTTRSYFTNAYVEGTDDFLGGGQVAVFQDSEIYFPTGNGVMSASGITFIHTVFKAARGLEFYKGFRNPDTLIDCIMPANTPLAWMVWKGAVRQNVFSLTYRVKDTNGNPIRIKDSQVGPATYDLSRELSAEEAKAFNPWNLLRAAPNGPADDWDPANARAEYEANGSDVFRMAVTGKAPAEDPGAGPFTSPAVSPTVRTGSTGATIGASVSPLRARDTPITWSTDSNLIRLSSTTGNSTVVTGSNTTNKAEYAVVKATAPNGFYVTVHVNVEPAFTDPPAFLKKPIVDAPANGKVTASYTLDLADKAGKEGKEDQSLISWFQCADPQCSAPRKVAVSRGNLPLRSYPLTAGDIGKYLRVTIQPKHNISDPGPEITAIATKPITAADIKTTTINPDFRNFVETENTTYENGEWTVIGTWTPSISENLVNGYGLRVSNPPASTQTTARAPNPHSALLYQNDAKTADMQVKVVMTPEKTAGQGFGIAGSPDDSERNQRADIYFKYDPRTRTGYALRFWRTIQSAEKCMFQLYKIDNGVGTPLSPQQQLTGVFKPNTTITISVTGTRVTVKGTNSTDSETLTLEGTITPNTFGGAGVYWSGSVPVGNSNVYSQIEITYPRNRSRAPSASPAP